MFIKNTKRMIEWSLAVFSPNIWPTPSLVFHYSRTMLHCRSLFCCCCCIFPQMTGQLYLLSAPSLYSQIALQYQTLTPPPPKIGILTEPNQFLKSLIFSKFNCFQTGQPVCWFWQLHKALSLVIFINSYRSSCSVSVLLYMYTSAAIF